jgi:hypothetical protein
MLKSVLLGPYIGDFANEILTFRPYIRYITHITPPLTKIYISSHTNRSFLYDWINRDMFIPIYEHISRDEPNQSGFIHTGITKTEFNQITKTVRNKIDCDSVEIQTLPYVKNTNTISLYQKYYTPFVIPYYNVTNHCDVICIFNKSDQSRDVYYNLTNKIDVTVIGDMNNGLEERNILLKNIMFLDNYLIMFNYVKQSKLVITNCSEWALICNLHQIPVFYWGAEASMYKENGVMNFENKKCMSICEMDTKNIVDMIQYCYNNIIRKV